MPTAREKAKLTLKHYLYTAGDLAGKGLLKHPDCDKEIESIVDFIIEAAVEEVLQRMVADASGSICGLQPVSSNLAVSSTNSDALAKDALKSAIEGAVNPFSDWQS
jgi:hypothetical protein